MKSEIETLIQAEFAEPAEIYNNPEFIKGVLSKVETEALKEPFTVETKTGRDYITSTAYKVTRSKTYLDGIGKQICDDLRAKTTAVNERRAEIREKLDNLRDRIKKPLEAWEAEEEKRVGKIKQQIALIRDCAINSALNGTSEAIQEVSERLRELSDFEFEEFDREAQTAIGTTAQVVSVAYTAAKEREAAALELERQREAARIELEQRLAEEREAAALEAQRIAKEREAEEAARAEEAAKLRAEADEAKALIREMEAAQEAKSKRETGSDPGSSEGDCQVDFVHEILPLERPDTVQPSQKAMAATTALSYVASRRPATSLDQQEAEESGLIITDELYQRYFSICSNRSTVEAIIRTAIKAGIVRLVEDHERNSNCI